MSPPHVASPQSLLALDRTVPRPQLTPRPNPNRQPRLSQGTSTHLNAKRSSAAFSDDRIPDGSDAHDCTLMWIILDAKLGDRRADARCLRADYGLSFELVQRRLAYFQVRARR